MPYGYTIPLHSARSASQSKYRWRNILLLQCVDHSEPGRVCGRGEHTCPPLAAHRHDQLQLTSMATDFTHIQVNEEVKPLRSQFSLRPKALGRLPPSDGPHRSRSHGFHQHKRRRMSSDVIMMACELKPAPSGRTLRGAALTSAQPSLPHDPRTVPPSRKKPTSYFLSGHID